MPINHQYQCGRMGEQKRKGGDLNEAVPYFASTVSGLQAQDACIWDKGEGMQLKRRRDINLIASFPYVSGSWKIFILPML